MTQSLRLLLIHPLRSLQSSSLMLIIVSNCCVQARYYVDEVKDKTGKDIDVSSWKQEYVEDLPEQENGYTSFS